MVYQITCLSRRDRRLLEALCASCNTSMQHWTDDFLARNDRNRDAEAKARASNSKFWVGPRAVRALVSGSS